MPAHITAHTEAGSPPLLTTEHGQSTINTRRPQNRSVWQKLGTFPRYPTVHHWELRDDEGNLLQTKHNPHWENLNV